MKIRTILITAAMALSLSPAAFAQNANLANPAALNEKAPAIFKAKFDTSKGPFVVEVHRDWAPNGADRFYNLVKNGFFDDTRFFRVMPGFMVQFGINGEPKVSEVWRSARIPDDRVMQSNRRGMMTFATSGRDSRTTQVFINFDDNSRLDGQGFAPFGQIISGMENVVDKIHSGYGESPNQGNVQMQGNSYLNSSFPRLDFIKKATIEK